MTTNLDSAAQADAALGRRYVLAAAVLWSVSGVVTKLLDLEGTTIAFYRSFFAGLALWPFVPRSRWTFRPVMIPLVLAFGAMVGLYIAAIKATSAANAIFLQCTATFWLVPAGALILGERPDRRAVAGIGLATVGIVMIVGFGYDPNHPGERFGILLGLASGLCYATVVLGLRALRTVDPVWLSVVNNLGGSLALAAFVLAMGWPLEVPKPGEFAALAVFGVVQMALPYVFFARGLRSLGAADAGLIALLEPVLNPIWVVLFHGERPEVWTVVGGAFLLGGILVRYVPNPLRREPRPPATS